MPPSRQNLLQGFTFSQHSLQCFLDCPRRFWLGYICRLPWPAVVAAPAAEHERRMQLGALFHRWIERTLRGLPASLPEAPLEARRWLAAWSTHAPQNIPLMREIECTLCVPLAVPPGAVRLLARYDLIAVEPRRRAVIVDWKAGRSDAVGRWDARIQTVLYLWLLVEASAALPWGPLLPEQVEMLYWFADAPRDPVRLRYNSEQHAANDRRLRLLLTEILARQTEAQFEPAVEDHSTSTCLCSYCVYRRRCGRTYGPGLAALCDCDAPFSLPCEGAAIPLSL